MSEGFSRFLRDVFSEQEHLPDLPLEICAMIGEKAVPFYYCPNTRDQKNPCQYNYGRISDVAECGRLSSWIRHKDFPLCGFHAVKMQRKRKIDEEYDDDEMEKEIEHFLSLSESEMEICAKNRYLNKRARVAVNRKIIEKYEI